MADKGKLPPVSDDERLYLLEQIKNYKILESKKTDVGSLAAKKRAWEEIARNFNSTGNFQKERHCLDFQQAEELHRLEMEQKHLKIEFNAEMNHETLQVAKVKCERESCQNKEIHRKQLRKLLNIPSKGSNLKCLFTMFYFLDFI